MEEKTLRFAQADLGPEMAALLEEVTQKLQESYQQLETKFLEVSRTLDSTSHQLKETQVEKDRSALYLDNILDSLNSGVLVIDLEGRVVLFNKAAQNITGYSIVEIHKKRYSEIFSSNQNPEFSAIVTLKQGKSFLHQEKEFVSKSGEKLCLGFSTTPLQDSAGNLSGVVEVFADLSKIKKLEEEIARVKTLAAVGQMAAEVAHAIRSPLSPIAGFADLLDRATPQDDPRKGYIQNILEGAHKLNETVENLLAFAKPPKLSLRQVDLAGFLDGVVGLFEMDLKRSQKKISIHKKYTKREIAARIDPDQFQQVILNLLQNACQAVGENGMVELTLDSFVSGREQMVYFKVSDNGPGMSPQVLEKIFTPFFTSKATGTGLGLATVKKIVEAHRGEVKIKSEVGKGTEVEIWIPRES